MTRILRGAQKPPLTSLLGVPVILGVLLFYGAGSPAQDSPKFIINEDCQVFDIASNNSIVYAVPHLKRIRRLVLERDDISVATPAGKTRQIVDADKFLPPTPPGGFVVNSLSWSPDGRRIAVSMTLQQAPAGFTMDKKEAKKRGNMDDNEDNAPILAKGGGRAIALLEDDGREIKVANSKTQFIEGGVDATWLADGKTAVYLTGGPPWAISRVQPEDGKTQRSIRGPQVRRRGLGREAKPGVCDRRSEPSRAADAGKARPLARIRDRDRAREELSGIADGVTLGRSGGIFRRWGHCGGDRRFAPGSTSADAGGVRAIRMGPRRATHSPQTRSRGAVEYFTLDWAARRDVQICSARSGISRL